MSGTKLFLDTNIILYLLNGDQTLAGFIQDKVPYISIISEIELLSFKEITLDDERQIKNFIKESKVININTLIKNDAIHIRKSYGNKLPDSIIAASAIYLDLPLITADGDFKKIEELQLIHYEK